MLRRDAELYNVLVFPQTGDRPIPDQSSGGDLDGDDYFICWDTRIIPERSTKAASYRSSKQLAIDIATMRIEAVVRGRSVRAKLGPRDLRMRGAEARGAMARDDGDVICRPRAQAHSQPRPRRPPHQRQQSQQPQRPAPPTLTLGSAAYFSPASAAILERAAAREAAYAEAHRLEDEQIREALAVSAEEAAGRARDEEKHLRQRGGVRVDAATRIDWFLNFQVCNNLCSRSDRTWSISIRLRGG